MHRTCGKRHRRWPVYLHLVVGLGGRTTGTIRRGIRELGQPAVGAAKGRIRHPGGGRKRTVEHDPSLREDLDRLVEPTSRGDPESPLRWTCKSVRQLAAALKRQGHQVSHRMVAEYLNLGFRVIL